MITLHHCHQTRSMRVLWLLNELEQPFELKVYPFDRTLRSDAFLTLNPLGRVPVLEIDGETLWESGACLEYLCERFPERGLGRLPGDIDRPDWLVWLHFAETLSQHVGALTQQHVVLEGEGMTAPGLMRLEVRRLEKCLGAIEARLSTPVENRDYLLTSGFSAVDVAVGQAVYMARHFRDFAGFPETAAWYERIGERPGFRAALPPPDADLLYARSFYPAPESSTAPAGGPPGPGATQPGQNAAASVDPAGGRV